MDLVSLNDYFAYLIDTSLQGSYLEHICLAPWKAKMLFYSSAESSTFGVTAFP